QHVVELVENRQRLLGNLQRDPVENIVESKLKRRRDGPVGRAYARDCIRHASQRQICQELLLLGYYGLPVSFRVEAAARGFGPRLRDDDRVAFQLDNDRGERRLGARSESDKSGNRKSE